MLRNAGHDVIVVNEHKALQGLPDEAHARNANEQGMLITKDGDYGALHVRNGIPACGVVYVKADASLAAIKPVFSISLPIAAMCAGVFLFPLSSLTGVLQFNLFVTAVEVGTYFIFFVLKAKKVKTR